MGEKVNPWEVLKAIEDHLAAVRSENDMFRPGVYYLHASKATLVAAIQWTLAKIDEATASVSDEDDDPFGESGTDHALYPQTVSAESYNSLAHLYNILQDRLAAISREFGFQTEMYCCVTKLELGDGHVSRYQHRGTTTYGVYWAGVLQREHSMLLTAFEDLVSLHKSPESAVKRSQLHDFREAEAMLSRQLLGRAPLTEATTPLAFKLQYADGSEKTFKIDRPTDKDEQIKALRHDLSVAEQSIKDTKAVLDFIHKTAAECYPDTIWSGFKSVDDIIHIITAIKRYLPPERAEALKAEIGSVHDSLYEEIRRHQDTKDAIATLVPQGFVFKAGEESLKGVRRHIEMLGAVAADRLVMLDREVKRCNEYALKCDTLQFQLATVQSAPPASQKPQAVLPAEITDTFARDAGWMVLPSSGTPGAFTVYRPNGSFYAQRPTERGGWDVANRLARQEAAEAIIREGNEKAHGSG